MSSHKIRNIANRMMTQLLILFSVILINGCGGSESPISKTSTPDISLLNAQTDFGVVVSGKSSDKDLSIRNEGDANLTIGQITKANPADNTFVIVSDDCSGATISPSSSCSLTIRFSPTSQDNYSDNIYIPSNDIHQGVLTATLRGKGQALGVSINSVGTVDQQFQTVKIAVSVTNRYDVPVTDLSGTNFSIFENGSPIEIVDCSNVIKFPVSVGLALDYSSSMLDYTADIENAAISFIDQLNTDNDEAEVIKFATDIEVVQQFTSDITALKASIGSAFLPVRAGTHFYDALWISINNTSSRSSDRRLAVIAVSDGSDSGSVMGVGEVIRYAKEKNIAVFTIGIGAVDYVRMQEIATETGGQFFFAPSSSELTSIYLKISEILSNQYTIKYKTLSAGGSKVTIDVKVENNGEFGESSKIADI